jgi:hypothetical protein
LSCECQQRKRKQPRNELVSYGHSRGPGYSDPIHHYVSIQIRYQYTDTLSGGNILFIKPIPQIPVPIPVFFEIREKERSLTSRLRTTIWTLVVVRLAKKMSLWITLTKAGRHSLLLHRLDGQHLVRICLVQFLRK